MKPKKCNCWIGIIYDYDCDDITDLYLNNYFKKIYLNETLSLIDLGSTNIQGGCYKLFTYCPLCGKKINWKKLRKALV